MSRNSHDPGNKASRRTIYMSGRKEGKGNVAIAAKSPTCSLNVCKCIASAELGRPNSAVSLSAVRSCEFATSRSRMHDTSRKHSARIGFGMEVVCRISEMHSSISGWSCQAIVADERHVQGIMPNVRDRQMMLADSNIHAVSKYAMPSRSVAVGEVRRSKEEYPSAVQPCIPKHC